MKPDTTASIMMSSPVCSVTQGMAVLQAKMVGAADPE
jgi:hypothetical protein